MKVKVKGAKLSFELTLLTFAVFDKWSTRARFVFSIYRFAKVSNNLDFSTT